MIKRRNFLSFLAIALAAGVIYSCNKLEKFFDHDKDPKNIGYAYTMTNEPGVNNILIYSRAADGTLKFIKKVNSGGAGSGSFPEAHGSLALDRERRLLFAVNTGANSISSFRIADNGSLTLVQTISSEGTSPVTLTLVNGFLYVANDGNVSGYVTSPSGAMELVETAVESLTNPFAEPGQIGPRPADSVGRTVIYVTQKTDSRIPAFTVSLIDGALSEAGPGGNAEAPTPFGFAIHHSTQMIVAHAVNGTPGASQISNLRTSPAGILFPLDTIPTQQTAASGVAVTNDEEFALITNTGSNTISSIKLNEDGTIQLQNAVAATTGGGPVDITISNDGNNVYTLNSTARSIGQYRLLPGGVLEFLGDVPGLTPAAAGLVVL